MCQKTGEITLDQIRKDARILCNGVSPAELEPDEPWVETVYEPDDRSWYSDVYVADHQLFARVYGCESDDDSLPGRDVAKAIARAGRSLYHLLAEVDRLLEDVVQANVQVNTFRDLYHGLSRAILEGDRTAEQELSAMHRSKDARIQQLELALQAVRPIIDALAEPQLGYGVNPGVETFSPDPDGGVNCPVGAYEYRDPHALEALETIDEALDGYRIVTIPAGYSLSPVRSFDERHPRITVKIRLRWICPQCGGPRGTIRKGATYDGSHRLEVDTWQNPCGHQDLYEDVRKEAADA